MATRKKPRKPAAKKRAAAARKPAARKVVRKAVTKKARARPAPKPKKTRDGGPMEWPTLSPYMAVADANRSHEFYERAFGLETTGMLMKDDAGRIQHAGMKLGEAAIMFAPQGMSQDMQSPATSGAVNGLSLYVYVPDVDALARRASAAGAKCLQEPADQFWGDRIAIFLDLDGYHWTFATHLAR